MASKRICTFVVEKEEEDALKMPKVLERSIKEIQAYLHDITPHLAPGDLWYQEVFEMHIRRLIYQLVDAVK
jgi:hypothetical protein